MQKMYLRLEAPFAAFRPLQTGAYHSTMPVPPPSAVYGLLLNLAAIEQRAELNTCPTANRDDLPTIAVAIGLPQGSQPEVALLFQHLHQYLVGGSDKKLARRTFGAKPWITPVYREILVNLDFLLGVQAEQWLCDRIRQGLMGELDAPRYGLPFAGDNNFLFDKISLLDEDLPLARWYYPQGVGRSSDHEVCQLTVWVDRSDSSKTSTLRFVSSEFFLKPPEAAWTRLPIMRAPPSVSL